MKKSLGKILFGIGVSSLALGASAFTNKTVETNLQMRYWGNDGTTGQYIELSSAPDITNNCNEPAPQSCVVQSENPSLGSTLSYSEATPANGVQPHPDANNAFYD